MYQRRTNIFDEDEQYIQTEENELPDDYKEFHKEIDYYSFDCSSLVSSSSSSSSPISKISANLSTTSTNK